jgi:phospholipid/cholesterol/gamma-HCH transport system substrate-binding protein
LRHSRTVARAAAVAVVLIAVAAVSVVLLGPGGTSYTVQARFQNASQLVKGNLVQVAGREIGTVQEIELTRDGQAEVTLSITDPDFEPLRRGTQATVRQASLSGVANRYIDLRLPPDDAPRIPDGGTIEQDATMTAVDLDQLFNTFDPDAREALQGVIQGSARQFEGRGEQQRRGLQYLNPTLAASSRLFSELNRDTELFERFVVSSSQLVTDVADRRDDLAGLVDGLATTTGAIGRRRGELADAIAQLPPFMRRANTTFVDLRGALDDLEPLVEESKPVARELRPLLADLRPLARDARPTLRDLSALVRRPGKGNDLIELARSTVALRDAAVRPMQANGARREDAFRASTRALGSATPLLADARPYAVDLTGWFDDFSHSGVYDALGAASRAAPNLNAFSTVNGVLTDQLVPAGLRQQLFDRTATLGQRNRCPGGAEHGTVFKPTPDFNCDESQVLPGG